MSTEMRNCTFCCGKGQVRAANVPGGWAQCGECGGSGRASSPAAVPEGALPPPWRGSLAQVVLDVPLPERNDKYQSGFVDAKAAILQALRDAGFDRAAVEADRAQQGEPVYFYRQKGAGTGWMECSAEHRAALQVGPAAGCYEHRTLYPVSNAATKAAAPADARIEALARKLAEHYPRILSQLRVDSEPVGHELVKACHRAAPVPDTGIPTVERDKQEHVMPPFAAPASQHGASAAVLEADYALVFDRLQAAAETLDDLGAKLNAADLRTIAQLFDESAASGFREGRNTKPDGNDNFRAPVSGTPTSGAVETDDADKKRMDWLDQNIFHRELDDFDKMLYKESWMWVTFAPRGTQGSARRIIDAAMERDALPSKTKAGNQIFNFNVSPTLTKEQEAAAEKGYCPACGAAMLREVNQAHGMRFCQCDHCKDIVVLGCPSEAKAGELKPCECTAKQRAQCDYCAGYGIKRAKAGEDA